MARDREHSRPAVTTSVILDTSAHVLPETQERPGGGIDAALIRLSS
jgi:hypothetical protein